VIPKFIQQFLSETSPVINGDGTNTRDFTHVENVVSATLLALETDHKSAVNQIYNVAFGSSTTLIELAEMIQKTLSERKPTLQIPELTFGPNRPGDIPHSHASIEKIQKLLGYVPHVSVETGIQKTVDWFLTQYIQL